MALLIYTGVAFLKAGRARRALLVGALLEIHPVAPGGLSCVAPELSAMQIWDCSPPGGVIPTFGGSSRAAEFSECFAKAPKT